VIWSGGLENVLNHIESEDPELQNTARKMKEKIMFFINESDPTGNHFHVYFYVKLIPTCHIS
jgi:hypothetical protein